MNLNQLLLAADTLNRFDAIEQLKVVLDKKIQEHSKKECFTIFYSDKHRFRFEWGLKNQDRKDALRLFVSDISAVRHCQIGDRASQMVEFEEKVYPLLLFSIAIKIIIFAKTLPLDVLPLLINEKNEILKKIISERFQSPYESDHNHESYGIPEQLSKKVQIKGIEIFEYLAPPPAKSDYLIFESDVPMFYQILPGYWLCPRPSTGYFLFGNMYNPFFIS
jgi:hypothetical protein